MFLIPVIQSLVKILNTNVKIIQISQSIYFCNINFININRKCIVLKLDINKSMRYIKKTSILRIYNVLCFTAYVVNTCYTAHLMHGIRELS